MSEQQADEAAEPTDTASDSGGESSGTPGTGSGDTESSEAESGDSGTSDTGSSDGGSGDNESDEEGAVSDSQLPEDLQATEDNPLARHPRQTGDEDDKIGADSETGDADNPSASMTYGADTDDDDDSSQGGEADTDSSDDGDAAS